MKNYKNFSIYDFSDYAEEITGDELFKINGGAEVENSHEGVAGANVGDTITRNDGTVVVLNQGDINYANEQLGNNGNNGTGNTNGNSGTDNNSNSGSNNTSNSSSTNNFSSGANNTGTSNTSTSESTPEVPEEIKQNSNAYAYYMSLQGRAKEEGNPDKYKGYNVLGSKVNIVMVGKEIQKQPLWQLSFGDRRAALIGAGYSIGIVINPNNLWDSGVKVSAEIGIGIEVGLPKKIGKGFSKVISSGNILSSTVDFSKPTSTCELEGFYNNAYVSAGVGVNFDIKNQSLQGLEVGNIGGGVYWGETKVYTAGEIVEGVVNTVAFIGNNFVLTPTMRRMTGGFKYIELDGQ